jgi:simple sugar transport system permease protein
VALALILGFVAIALARGSLGTAVDAYLQMLWGGIGDLPSYFSGASVHVLTRPWGEAATKASLLTLTGLSVAVAFSVGLFNIGAQGQMLVGALGAAVMGAAPGLPAPLRAVVCLTVAALSGGIYGLLPGVLRVRRGVHEVISTIMLNWVAVSLIEGWLIVGPLAAGSVGNSSRAGTVDILPSAHLPRLLGDSSRMNLGFPLALIIALLAWAWLSRTWHGFEVRAVGLGPEAARTAGVRVERRICEVMFLSGALAGLAGAVMVQGTEFKYPATLAANYGFDGIAIALIGLAHPLGVAASALFFGILRAGGTGMQLFGVHKSFPELIQGLALLLVAGKLFWERLLKRRKPKTVEVQR